MANLVLNYITIYFVYTHIIPILNINVKLNTKKLYNSTMIRNNVSTLIGMRRATIAETARLADLDYSTVYNLYYDKTNGIEFETLNKLCFALDCNPNDLFRYIPD